MRAHDAIIGAGGLKMAGALDLQGHAIQNVANIQATSLNGQAITADQLMEHQ